MFFNHESYLLYLTDANGSGGDQRGTQRLQDKRKAQGREYRNREKMRIRTLFPALSVRIPFLAAEPLSSAPLPVLLPGLLS